MGAKKNNKPASRKAKPAKAEDDSKKPWWFNQPLPIDRFTGWLVVWTCCLSIATFGLIAVAILQWRELHSTDEHIAEQVKITSGQLEEMRAAQRAWIALESIKIGGPLEFGDGKASVQIDLILKNVGSKPAVHTNVFLSLNPQRLTASGLDPPSFCPEGNFFGDFGYTLFPSASTEEYQWFPQTWSASGLSQNPKASQFETFEYFVNGCITYESVGDASLHSTRFAAQLTPSKVFPISKGPRNRYESAEITLSVMPAGHYAN